VKIAKIGEFLNGIEEIVNIGLHQKVVNFLIF
jgi:hypothetical protein